MPLVPVLGDAARRTHDPAQEDVGEAPRDAPRIRRRERRHDVLGRAERVVLVPVLDVGDAAHVVEPGRELDARREVLRSSPPGSSRDAAPRCRRGDCGSWSFTASQWNSTSWLPCTIVRPWPAATKSASASKTTRCLAATAESFTPRVIGAVAEAVLALLVARVRRAAAFARQDAHPDEVDEVSRDDQTPSLAGARARPIVREQAREVGVDERGAARAGGREVVQIVTEMNVRKDEKTLVCARVHGN